MMFKTPSKIDRVVRTGDTIRASKEQSEIDNYKNPISMSPNVKRLQNTPKAKSALKGIWGSNAPHLGYWAHEMQSGDPSRNRISEIETPQKGKQAATRSHSRQLTALQ